MIRVLIVDDYPNFRLMLRFAIEKEPDLEVVGEARNGEEAVALCANLQPDVITMDINMPGMDGYRAITRIMEQTPCPIIVLTGVDSQELLNASFKALSLGAITILPKPLRLNPSNPLIANIIYQIRTLASVKVPRRSSREQALPPDNNPDQPSVSLSYLDLVPQKRHPYKIVGIGISTGGPPALQYLLKSLPVSFPIPIAIVQHISNGFVDSLVKWLFDTTGYPCKIASTGEVLEPGSAYFAPDDRHLEIMPGGKASLSDDKPFGVLRPAAEYLFNSLAKNIGGEAIGVIMTGMGHDGANGLLNMHNTGAYTIAQDEKSCAIFGMPREAIKLEAVDEVLPLDLIGPRLLTIANQK